MYEFKTNVNLREQSVPVVNLSPLTNQINSIINRRDALAKQDENKRRYDEQKLREQERIDHVLQREKLTDDRYDAKLKRELAKEQRRLDIENAGIFANALKFDPVSTTTYGPRGKRKLTNEELKSEFAQKSQVLKSDLTNELSNYDNIKPRDSNGFIKVPSQVARKKLKESNKKFNENYDMLNNELSSGRMSKDEYRKEYKNLVAHKFDNFKSSSNPENEYVNKEAFDKVQEYLKNKKIDYAQNLLGLEERLKNKTVSTPRGKQLISVPQYRKKLTNSVYSAALKENGNKPLTLMQKAALNKVIEQRAGSYSTSYAASTKPSRSSGKTLERIGEEFLLKEKIKNMFNKDKKETKISDKDKSQTVKNYRVAIKSNLEQIDKYQEGADLGLNSSKIDKLLDMNKALNKKINKLLTD